MVDHSFQKFKREGTLESQPIEQILLNEGRSGNCTIPPFLANKYFEFLTHHFTDIYLRDIGASHIALQASYESIPNTYTVVYYADDSVIIIEEFPEGKSQPLTLLPGLIEETSDYFPHHSYTQLKEESPLVHYWSIPKDQN